jgi:cytosine/adenosine deaminase-related metal-dependent hydrolase
LPGGAIAPGRRADLVAIASDGAAPEMLLDRYVFATDAPAPHAVFVGGRRRV